MMKMQQSHIPFVSFSESFVEKAALLASELRLNMRPGCYDSLVSESSGTSTSSRNTEGGRLLGGSGKELEKQIGSLTDDLRTSFPSTIKDVANLFNTEAKDVSSKNTPNVQSPSPQRI
jgi:hypothetical protein